MLPSRTVIVSHIKLQHVFVKMVRTLNTAYIAKARSAIYVKDADNDTSESYCIQELKRQDKKVKGMGLHVFFFIFLRQLCLSEAIKNVTLKFCYAIYYPGF